MLTRLSLRAALRLPLVFGVLIALALLVGETQPRGAQLAYVRRSWRGDHLYLADVTRGLRQRIAPAAPRAYSLTWSPDGMRLAYINEHSGMVEIFTFEDNLPRRTSGERVATNAVRWSPEGGRLVFIAQQGSVTRLVIHDALSGAAAPLTASDMPHGFPSWSPDGSRLAFVSLRDGNAEIYAVEPDGRSLQRLTVDSAWDSEPAWSADGSLIAFVSNRSGSTEIYVVDTACPTLPGGCAGRARRLTYNRFTDIFPSWSPDGAYLAFASVRDNRQHIVLMDAECARRGGACDETELQLTGGNNDHSIPIWSPDADYLAFVILYGSQATVAVARVNTGAVWRLTPLHELADSPAWRP